LPNIGELEEYWAANATHKSCVNSLMKACYRAVGILHFYTLTTLSEDEYDGKMDSNGQKIDPYRLKCWTLKVGSSVVDAAAMVDIHIARNFIRCDIVAFEDFHKCNGDKVKVILEGRLKSETKKYVVNDGDIILDFYYHKSPEI